MAIATPAGSSVSSGLLGPGQDAEPEAEAEQRRA